MEVKKVDRQGRLILPSDWRKEELKGIEEVYVIKRRQYLKIIPKLKIKLSKFFDKIDLDVDAIGSWEKFEKARTEKFRE